MIRKSELRKELRRYFSAMGAKGGKKGGPARMAQLTPEQRAEMGRKGALKRWAKKKGGL